MLGNDFLKDLMRDLFILLGILAITIPLALWKLAEIIRWSGELCDGWRHWGKIEQKMS